MKKINKNTGITLVALVITIIILLILAGISISSLTNSGLFEKAREAEQKSENAQIKEETTLGYYENKIGEYVSGNRDTNKLTKINKEILWDSSETGTTEVKLSKNISDFSFIIVYYALAGNGNDGSLMFETSQNYKMTANYVNGTAYVIGTYSIDIEQNIVKMTVSGNKEDWKKSSLSYLRKIVGIY